jgi:hypothetical protein
MSRGPTRAEEIREELLKSDDGLTIKQLSKIIGVPQDLIISTLSSKSAYGCYVDRWIDNESGFSNKVSVYKCVVVPSNAPMPRNQKLTEAQLEVKRKTAREHMASLTQLRKKQREKNAEIRATRDAEREERKLTRARIKAELEALKAAEKAEQEARRIEAERVKKSLNFDAQYIPKKTRWAFPPPWSN